MRRTCTSWARGKTKARKDIDRDEYGHATHECFKMKNHENTHICVCGFMWPRMPDSDG